MIDLTSSPEACRARMADSRPAPGPLTSTSTERIPTSFTLPPAFCAATWAAKGVPLREPLNPIRPADDQERRLPSGSAIETIVLLKVAWMCATPWGTLRFSFFLPPFLSFFYAFAIACLLAPSPYFLVAFFLPATAPRRGPLRVRELVWVRCPRTGSPLR